MVVAVVVVAAPRPPLLPALCWGLGVGWYVGGWVWDGWKEGKGDGGHNHTSMQLVVPTTSIDRHTIDALHSSPLLLTRPPVRLAWSCWPCVRCCAVRCNDASAWRCTPASTSEGRLAAPLAFRKQSSDRVPKPCCTCVMYHVWVLVGALGESVD